MFTAPKREHEHLLDSDPGAVLSRGLRLRLQRPEIASGSIRIHRPDLQQRVFDVVGISKEEAEARSASCCARCATARRRTAASRSASTAS